VSILADSRPKPTKIGTGAAHDSTNHKCAPRSTRPALQHALTAACVYRAQRALTVAQRDVLGQHAGFFSINIDEMESK